MDLGSDLEIARLLADDCARDIAWMIGSLAVQDGVMAITGWALVTAGTPVQARFLVNGVPFSTILYPIESPDLAQHFWGVANSDRARFECRIPLAAVPTEPYWRFEFVQNAEVARARATAWWYPAGQPSFGAPTGERIARVIGADDSFNFELGGATLFHRIQDYLSARFARRYESFAAILDWGCGAGRLLSHFGGVRGPQVWGSDIDHDNLRHCQERLPFATCRLFPLQPPTDIPDATFDLVIGVSVCTHLSEANQRRWLAELRRLSRPGGLVLLSVQGPAQMALYRVDPQRVRDVERLGFVTLGVNPAINDIVGAADYYLDVIQTQAHIRENWGRELEVLEFLPGLAANQDLVVMRAPVAPAGG